MIFNYPSSPFTQKTAEEETKTKKKKKDIGRENEISTLTGLKKFVYEIENNVFEKMCIGPFIFDG